MSQQTNNSNQVTHHTVSPKLKKILNAKFSFRDKISRKVVRNKNRNKNQPATTDAPKDGASALSSKFQIDTQVFGVSLEDAIARSIIQDEIPLPTVFRECIDYIEFICMDSEGLYRVGGAKTQIDAVKKKYDNGEYIDFSYMSPETITSLLKLYLRELPHCIIPDYILAKLEEVCFSPDLQLRTETFQYQLNLMPIPNCYMLSWLLLHMDHITSREKTTKMNVQNLIIVFSPTLRISMNLLVALYDNLYKVFPNSEIIPYRRPKITELNLELEGLSNPLSQLSEAEVLSEMSQLSRLKDSVYRVILAEEKGTAEPGEFSDECTVLIDRLQNRVQALKDRLETLQTSEHQEVKELQQLLLRERELQLECHFLQKISDQFRSSIDEERQLLEETKKDINNMLAVRNEECNNDNTQDTTVELDQLDADHMSEQELAESLEKLIQIEQELQNEQKSILNNLSRELEECVKLRVQLEISRNPNNVISIYDNNEDPTALTQADSSSFDNN